MPRCRAHAPPAPDRCRLCWLWANDARYRRLWGGGTPAAGLLLAAEDCGAVDGLLVPLSPAGEGRAGEARGLRAAWDGATLRLAGVCNAVLPAGPVPGAPGTWLGRGEATGGSDCPPGAVVEALIVDGWEP